MKTSAIIASISIIGGALAAPSSLRHMQRQSVPSPAQVITSITSWKADVLDVDEFLNLAHIRNPIDLKRAAQATLLKAKDEPEELKILAGLGAELGPTGQQAVLTLEAVFGGVVDSLQSIFDNPGDASSVSGFVGQINSVRCCSVLPSLDTLWPAAANAVGVADQVDLIVPRPNACTDGTIIC